MIDRCPIYTTKDLFGGNNVHSVYVLRSTDFKEKWIFKPTQKIDPYLSKLVFLKQNEAEKRIEAKRPVFELMTKKEHLAYKLNFHKRFLIPAIFFVEINEPIPLKYLTNMR